MRVYRHVSPTSQIRVEVRLKSGHLFWAKYQEGSEVVDLIDIFKDYWGSIHDDFTVLRQLIIIPPPVRVDLIGRTEPVVFGSYSGLLEVRFSTIFTVRTLCHCTPPTVNDLRVGRHPTLGAP